jgi:uncharacterized C2H2 Zn-finger protein
MEQLKSPVFDRLDALRHELSAMIASNNRVLELEAQNKVLSSKLDSIRAAVNRILSADDNQAELAADVVMAVSLDNDDEEAIKCDPCGTTFSAARYLKRHNNKMHGTGKTYACTKCNKKYAALSSLRRHTHVMHR